MAYGSLGSSWRAGDVLGQPGPRVAFVDDSTFEGMSLAAALRGLGYFDESSVAPAPPFTSPVDTFSNRTLERRHRRRGL